MSHVHCSSDQHQYWWPSVAREGSFLVGGVSWENAVGARVGYVRNRRGRRWSLLGSTSWHSCQLHTGDGCCVTGKAGAFILWWPGELHWGRTRFRQLSCWGSRGHIFGKQGVIVSGWVLGRMQDAQEVCISDDSVTSLNIHDYISEHQYLDKGLPKKGTTWASSGAL